MSSPSTATVLPVVLVTLMTSVPEGADRQLATWITCRWIVLAWYVLTFAITVPFHRTCTVPHDAHSDTTSDRRLATMLVRVMLAPCVLVE